MIALLLGFSYSYFTPTETFFVEIPFTMSVAGYFLAGIVFFGYFAFLPSIFLGLQLGAEKNAAIFLYIIPLILATYAGTKLGFVLQDDFFNKKNYMESVKTIAILLIFAIILAVAIEMSLPTILEYWPKDFLGMNVTQGKSIGSLIGDISGLMRR
jgi:uncharacterized membrane-anchored protein